MNATLIDASQVMFWNIWGHRHPRALHDFIRKHLAETDVFCLTEVTDIECLDLGTKATTLKYSENVEETPSNVDGRHRLTQAFGDTYIYMYGTSKRSDWTCEKTDALFRQVGFGSMMMYSRELNVIATGEQLLCEGIEGVRPRILQWMVYEKFGIRYLILHFHGIWLAHNTKGDDPARQVQSAQVLNILADLATQHTVDKIVFGGDFNLDDGTLALAELSDFSLNTTGVGPFYNLITGFGIKNTRTPQYRKWGLPGESMSADYVFTGSNVAVSSLQVDCDELASDHAPVIVSFR
jgi:endonuclease/exonuclease/phosphatase family metal-dependent hydrolase